MAELDCVHSRPKQASLAIDFLIIGGGLAGLASAIALRRVGHRVTVLERNSSINVQNTAGVALAPNLSKIMYHWGLRTEMQSIAVNSQAITITLCDTGEILGTHVWEEEMLREMRGDFLFVHYADYHMLLYNAAVSHGANVRFNTQVTSIGSDGRSVTLSSGEVVRGDVIVGADGTHGLSRALFEDEDPPPPKMNLYCTTVPKKLIMEDPELRFYYDRPHASMFSHFGDSRLMFCYPLGGVPELALLAYGPADDHHGTWEDQASRLPMERLLDSCEPKLRKLSRLAKPPVCLPIVEYPPLDEWVHESGRLVVIGQAAHSLPEHSIQTPAMAIEDGAVLAKLFSHLRNEDQIASFLYAFRDLRQERCEQACVKEFQEMNYMTLPPGEFQEHRDQTMRVKRDAGRSILDAAGDLELNPLWEQIKRIFGYDAEDEADNWWNDWGLLKERSIGREVPIAIFDNLVVERRVSARRWNRSTAAP